MKARAAVTYEKGTFTFEDIELDEPRHDEVLVKIVASGVCHTDVGGRDGILPFPLPGVLGHEGAGIVEQVGSSVSNIKVGDHVAISFAHCGVCDNCISGHPARCDRWPVLNFMGRMDDGTTRLHNKDGKELSVFFGQSSFSTYAIANQRQVAVIPKDVDIALMGPLGCGFGTGAGTVINVLKARPGDSIAIYGTGAVGLAAVMGAKICGCSKIIAVDIHDNRLELAKELGATDVFNSKDGGIVEAVQGMTGGKGAKLTLDTTGIETVLRAAVNAASAYGVICTIAMSTQDLTLHIEPELMGPGRTIMGSTEGDMISKIFVPQLVEFYKQGLFPFDKLCKFYDFEDIDKAFADSKSGVTIKPILRMPE